MVAAEPTVRRLEAVRLAAAVDFPMDSAVSVGVAKELLARWSLGIQAVEGLNIRTGEVDPNYPVVGIMKVCIHS